MARAVPLPPSLPLLCAALLLPCAAAAAAARCRVQPRDVPHARVAAAPAAPLGALLRYSCEPGYKRRAGTSSLTQCARPRGAAEPAWSQPTLQCIRDPALPPAPEPDGTGGPWPTRAGAAATATPGSAGRAPKASVPATPPPATHQPAVSTRTLLWTLGLLALLFIAAAGAAYCWRRRRRMKAGPRCRRARVPGPAEGVEMLPPGAAATG